MKTIKGGAFTGTGTAASYTVPTVRQSAYRVRSPAFHRETLFLHSLCSIKKPAEGAETGNKRVLSVSVSLSLSLSSKILSSLLSQILKSPRAPSRITNNSLFPVSFRPFLQFLSRKKKIKGERKKSGHHAWWAKHSILTFACFSSIVSLHDYAIAYVLQKQNSPIWLLFFSLIRLLT